MNYTSLENEDFYQDAKNNHLIKITLPDGTCIEGAKEDVEKYLPPIPQRNWDGSLIPTC